MYAPIICHIFFYTAVFEEKITLRTLNTQETSVVLTATTQHMWWMNIEHLKFCFWWDGHFATSWSLIAFFVSEILPFGFFVTNSSSRNWYRLNQTCIYTENCFKLRKTTITPFTICSSGKKRDRCGGLGTLGVENLTKSQRQAGLAQLRHSFWRPPPPNYLSMAFMLMPAIWPMRKLTTIYFQLIKHCKSLQPTWQSLGKPSSTKSDVFLYIV